MHVCACVQAGVRVSINRCLISLHVNCMDKARMKEIVPPGQLVKNIVCRILFIQSCLSAKCKCYIIWFHCRRFAYLLNLKISTTITD